MKREIKFRLYDKELGMDYNPKLGLGNNDLNNQFATALGELMQYTGLKDKNGKEIYEGDIVKMYVGEKSRIVGSVTYGGWQYSVTMKVAGKDKTNYFGYNSEDIELDKLEIIGNIYENPELLK